MKAKHRKILRSILSLSLVCVLFGSSLSFAQGNAENTEETAQNEEDIESYGLTADAPTEPWSLDVTTVDQNGNPIAGIEFSQERSGHVYYSETDVNGHLVFNENVQNLDLGETTLTEEYVPNNYINSYGDISLMVEWDNDTEEIVLNENESVNLPSDYEIQKDQSDYSHWVVYLTLVYYAEGYSALDDWTLEILQTDEEGNPLENAEFELDGPETTEITVKKIWDDDDDVDADRPVSLTFRIYANGIEIDAPAAVTRDDVWSYTFGNLPKYDSDGNEIEYTVTEDRVYQYGTSYEDDGLTITNYHAPGKASITVTKVWDDNHNKDGSRPNSINIDLLADGTVVDTLELTGSGDVWVGSFPAVDVYNRTTLIEYSVQEESLAGYGSTITGTADTGFVITNTAIETIDIPLSLIWDDEDNADELRPSEVIVHLFADEEEVNSVILSEENQWSDVFSNLPKYDGDKEIQYTIVVEEVDGYESEIEGNNNFTIVQTHTPEEKIESFSITKTATSEPANGVTYMLGEEIDWEITVINTGNTSLSNITILDELTGDQWDIATLDPVESQTFDASYFVTEADLLNGEVANQVLGYFVNSDGDTVEESSNTPIVSTDNPQPSLFARKIADTEEATEGDVVTYTLYVLNNGNTTLENILVSDPLTNQSWTIELLAPGKGWTQNVEYTVTEEDAAKGSLTNSFTVSAANPIYDNTDPDSLETIDTTDSVTITVTPKAQPHVSFSFDVTSEPANGQDYTYAEEITFVITIVNDGAVDLQDVLIECDLTGDTWTLESLSVGEKAEFSCSYKVTLSDAEALSVMITASCTAIAEDGTQLSASDQLIIPVEEIDYYPRDEESSSFETFSSSQMLSSQITDVTDKNGSLIFSNLVEGTYTLTEIQAPDGYIITLDEPIVIVVTYSVEEGYQIDTAASQNLPEGWTFEDGVLHLNIVNQKEEEYDNQLTIMKVDADTGEPLEGAEFELTLLEILPVEEEYEYVTLSLEKETSGNPSGLDLETTYFDFKIFINRDGSPYSGELSVCYSNSEEDTIVFSDGYATVLLLRGESVDIDVASGVDDIVITEICTEETKPEQCVGYINGVVILDNFYQETNELEVGCISEDTSVKFVNAYRAYLPISIRNDVSVIADDGLLNYSGITDTNGEISFTDMQAGTWRITETTSPEGYIDPDWSMEFTVNEDLSITYTQDGQEQNSYDVIMVVENTAEIQEGNEPLTWDLEINKVDENGNPLDGADFVLENRSEFECYEVSEWILEGNDVFTDNKTKEASVDSYSAQYVNLETILPALDYYVLDSGQYDLTFHVQLDQGLEFNPSEFEVYLEWQISQDYYDLDTSNLEDGCDFHFTIHLSDLYNDGIVTEKELGQTSIHICFTIDLEEEDVSKDYISEVFYTLEGKGQEIYTSNHDTVSFSTCQINILKTDANTGSLLEGAVFGIYDDEACTNPILKNGQAYTAVSDQNGIAVFSGLASGTYYINERSAPSQYVLSDVRQDVVLGEPRSCSITVQNTQQSSDDPEEFYPMSSSMSYAYVAISHESIGESSSDSSEFCIDLLRDGTVYDGKLTCITQDGEISTISCENGTAFLTLSEGDTIWLQCIKDSDEIHITEITDCSSLAVYQNGEVISTESDVDLGILTDDTSLYFKASYGSDNELSIAKTLATGNVFTWTDLEPGIYTITETQTPDGYVPLDDWIVVSVEYDENGELIINTDESSNLPDNWIFADGTLNLTIENQKEEVPTWSLEIEKTNDNGELLQGAAFSLEQVDALPLSGSTDSDGILTFTELQEGEYTLTEVEAPTGYIKLEDSISITVIYDSDTGYSIAVEDSENLPDGWTFDNGVLHLTLINQLISYALPEAGGNGIFWFMAIGLPVTICSWLCIMYVQKRRHRLA